MTRIFERSPEQNEKFRKEAARSAHLLKLVQSGRDIPRSLLGDGKWPRHIAQVANAKLHEAFKREKMTIGFAFDDGVVTADIEPETVKSLTESELANYLYGVVIAAVQTRMR